MSEIAVNDPTRNLTDVKSFSVLYPKMQNRWLVSVNNLLDTSVLSKGNSCYTTGKGIYLNAVWARHQTTIKNRYGVHLQEHLPAGADSSYIIAG